MTVISRIDQEIDAVRKELRSREKIKPLSAGSWQLAWDKHPELRQRENDLFLQRGLAQKERDEKVHKDWMKQKRSKRSIKCPTCGYRTLAA